jgi:hypothetical protein
MPPIRSIKNQYRGINAHLHSLWQAKGGWNSFHTAHIDDLMRLMKAQLRPMGYTADLEQSVQVRRLDELAGEPESDVSIYDLNPVRAAQVPPRFPTGSQQLILDIPQALQLGRFSAKKLSAVGIYHVEPGNDERGKPVAWVELLSPSNKPGGRDDGDYYNKRLKLIESGIELVEIDYLHESGPTLANVPVYRVRKNQLADPNSHPYRIAVINPRPAVEEGQVIVTGFDVDNLIPIIPIPLNGLDVLDFNFGAAYTKTIEEAFYGDEVNYSQLPLNFERYSPEDQSSILNRMLTVLTAAQEGKNLETIDVSKPINDLSLEDALEKFKTLV